MPELNPDQTLAIAQQFSRLARVVEDYRLNHFDQLTDLQQSGLASAEDHLRRTANAFLDYGLNEVMDNAQGSIDQLTQITQRLTRDVERLNDVTKALNVIGVVVQLASAFSSANPAAIASALAAAAAAV
jgi:hypothetical protein